MGIVKLYCVGTENVKQLWSGKRGSNPRPLPWQGNALPLSYSRSLTVKILTKLGALSILAHPFTNTSIPLKSLRKMVVHDDLLRVLP